MLWKLPWTVLVVMSRVAVEAEIEPLERWWSRSKMT